MIHGTVPPYMLPLAQLVALSEVAEAFASLPALDDLVAYWTMDEAGSVPRIDSSGNGHTLSVNGVVNSTVGKINNGVIVGGYLFSNDTAFAAAGPFTAFCWARAQNIVTNGAVLGHYTPGGPSGWAIYQRFNDRWHFVTNATEIFHTTPIVAGTYFLIVVTSDGAGTVTIRVNNGSDVSGAGVIGNPAIQFRVLADELGSGFGGRVDEVGIYNRVLSSAEKDALWNAGVGKQYPFA